MKVNKYILMWIPLIGLFYGIYQITLLFNDKESFFNGPSIAITLNGLYHGLFFGPAIVLLITC